MLMKLSKLLVLSALLTATVSSASAAIVDGVRQKPVPETMGFVGSTDDDYTTTFHYLYNVDAGKFFMEGNSWGTQVSLFDNQGLKVAFTPDVSYPEAYLFRDFSISKNTWHRVFFDGDGHGGMFVDLGSQANYRWGVELNGATFRLYAASEENGNPGWEATTDADGNVVERPAYREGQYMGWDANGGDNVCSPYLTVEAGHCINWAFVAPEVYDAFVVDFATYEAAEKLRAAIEDYKAQGFTDTAAAEALYLNESATLEELEQAKADLDAAFVAWGSSQASVENPADMTSKINNPNFDGASNAGWLGTAPNMTGSGSHGPANVAEHWNKTFDTYQDIEGLPVGVYQLTAETSWRGTWDNLLNNVTGSKVYVKVGENESSVPFNNILKPLNTESLAGPTSFGTNAAERSEEHDGVTYYYPDDPSCFRVYADKGWYDTKLVFFKGEEGTLRLGVALPQGVSSDNWSCFDSFSLKFFGNGDDAVKLFADNAWNYVVLELDEDEVLFTEQYLEAYNEAVLAYNPDDVASVADYMEKEAVVKAAYEALQKNIDLWKQWKTAVQKAGDRVTDLGWTDPWNKAGGMSDYLYDVEDIELERALTNEELEEEIAKIQALIEECEDFAKANLMPGQDVTFYLQNPDFESGVHTSPRPADPNGNGGDYGTADGWHADKFYGGNFTPGPAGYDNDASVNHCFESWHCWNFDLWQEVNNLPAGVYQIDVQGYVRCEANGYNAFDDLPSIPVKLYMNNSLIDFPDVYSEEVAAEHYLEDGTLPEIESHSWNGSVPNYPNSMGAAGLCFNWGMYKKSAFGLVKEGEPMRIGVKSVNMNADWWCIWDNFKLTYQGFLPEYVKPALQDALATINLEGKLIGTDVRANVEKLIADANALMNEEHDNNDTAWGRAMYDLLDQIYDITPTVEESVALFVKLNDALVNLETALDTYVDSPAYEEAENLRVEVTTSIEDLTNAQAEEYIVKISAMLTKLRLPSDAEIAQASDQNPLDVTSVILSPSFENDEWGYPENSNEGWNNPGNLGNDASDTQADQKLCFAMEFWQMAFDLYQEFYGMPAGTYMLQVDGWCRNGSNEENYTAWQSNPDASMACLYAKDGEDTYYSAPLANMMKAAPIENIPFTTVDGDEIYELVETALGETTYWLPNTMIGGRSFLDLGKENGSIDGAYTSKVILKVKEDGKLRIGVKKDVELTNSWVVVDNFRLFYYGANSTLQPSGNALTVESIAMGKPVKVEFFTLDGRKVNSLQKGIMIQKVTLDNGNVVVRKIRY